jgi:hypothetical protein
MAVRNMKNVQTMRIINGHFNLTTILLNEFFAPKRERFLKKLWLETSSLAGVPHHENWVSWKGLESIRLRRLQLSDSKCQYALSRAGPVRLLHNGAGGEYETTVEILDQENPLLPQDMNSVELLDRCPAPVRFFNGKMYQKIPEADEFLSKHGCDESINARVIANQETSEAMNIPAYRILNFAKESLRSLSLDWVLTSNPTNSEDDIDRASRASKLQSWFFYQLSCLTFPNLRAFQLRNAVTRNTGLIPGIYLLHPQDLQHDEGAELRCDMLEFMERHANLDCLAWPMDRFFSHHQVSDEVRERARAVVTELGRSLVSLRVDCTYSEEGEVQTDVKGDGRAKETRISRRLFVTEFAPRMKKLVQLKMEGGIPRDEKRETIRAVYACPLEKLVMIGVTCPVGNTWGIDGEDLDELDDTHPQFNGLLEPEAKDAILESTESGLHLAPSDYAFRAEFGWPPSPPMLQTIAMHHGATITELKFCGYNGSPVLHQATPITSAMLYHLRYLPRLRTLILSCWLLTFYEFDWHEADIIEYWLKQRDSVLTAAVPTQPNDFQMLSQASGSSVTAMNNTSADPQLEPIGPNGAHQTDLPIRPNTPLDMTPWDKGLERYFAPSALANAVFDLLGPHLSPWARAAKHQDGNNGVKVRASFCLGVQSSDIFDLDVWIDEKGVIPHSWKGPREEGEKERWWGKLKARQWF